MHCRRWINNDAAQLFTSENGQECSWQYGITVKIFENDPV